MERYAFALEDFRTQLLHAYIEYNKGFGNRVFIAALDISEMKNCCVIIISFL